MSIESARFLSLFMVFVSGEKLNLRCLRQYKPYYQVTLIAMDKKSTQERENLLMQCIEWRERMEAGR